jgi:hypothetical protein
MNKLVGSTFEYEFVVTYKGQPHNAAIVQVSFLKGNGSEDTLTIGGTEPNDTRLIKLAETGRYGVSYKLDVVGEWIINERWTDNNWTDEIKGRSFPLTVDADQNSFSDKVAP